jgi:hypothetical protein
MLNVFDKLEAKGIRGDAAVAEAEERLTITQAPKMSVADERPVRRREQGCDGVTGHYPTGPVLRPYEMTEERGGFLDATRPVTSSVG